MRSIHCRAIGLVDLGFDQVGEHVEQRLRQIVRRRRGRALAQLFDHRVQLIELPGDLVAEVIAILAAIIDFQMRLRDRYRRA